MTQALQDVPIQVVGGDESVIPQLMEPAPDFVDQVQPVMSDGHKLSEAVRKRVAEESGLPPDTGWGKTDKKNSVLL